MNSEFLLERAKYRRRIAALALRRVAIKKEMTPDEVKKAVDSNKKLQSIFGAPKDANGKPVGKAGRTIVLMEKWLDTKSEYGLPPVGERFKTFITQQMDSSNYIWGHDEAVRDLSRDIHYNFGFDPSEVSLVEQKKDEHYEQANLSHMAPMVQPMQGPLNMNAEVKGFTKKAQYAYQSADVDDHLVLPETPVVTREDYYDNIKEDGDIEKAKAASEFEKEPAWTFNQRNVGKNTLLEDKSSAEMRREAPSSSLDEEKQYGDYKKPDGLYPIRGFATRPGLKQFAAFSGIFTFVKTPEGWFGPIKRVDNEGWDWETAIPDTLMPSSIAAELDKRAQGADRVFIDRDGMDQFLEAASPSKAIKAFASKKK